MKKAATFFLDFLLLAMVVLFFGLLVSGCREGERPIKPQTYMADGWKCYRGGPWDQWTCVSVLNGESK